MHVVKSWVRFTQPMPNFHLPSGVYPTFLTVYVYVVNIFVRILSRNFNNNHHQISPLIAHGRE